MKKESTILAIPTDTCYGLACNFDDEVGYQEIYELKWREEGKPLAFVVEKFEDVETYVHITPEQLEFLRNYPYPFTLLAQPKIPIPLFLDPEKYIYFGLRVAEKCIDANICNSISFPLFLTSANKSGQKESYTRWDVMALFGDIVTIFWEKSGWQMPSNIFSFVWDTLEIEYKRKNY
jgi:L-threonylcarbamoyladenylate synthase